MEKLDLFILWFFEKGIRITLIAGGAFLLNLMVQASISKMIKKKIRRGAGIKKRTETLISVLGGTSRFVIIIMAILMVLSELGVNIAALVAGVGVMALAVGMAAREIIADFLAGFFLVIESQYNIGDEVKISGTEGRIKEITLRKTIIEGSDGLVYSIPNGQIKTVAVKKN